MFKPIEFLYFLIFRIVSFLIFIGELTEKVIFIPFKLFKKKPENIYLWRLKSFHLRQFIFKSIRFLILVIIKISFDLLKISVNISKKIIEVIIIKPLNLISIKLKFFLVGFFVCLFIIIINEIFVFVKNLPSPAVIGKVNFQLSTHIYDRNKKLLYEIYRNENRTPIKIESLPKYITQASIAIEDKDFYSHKGVSLFSGIFRAAKEIMINKKLQGGSTITQQLIKTALLSPERTLKRKIKEIVLAIWAERLYSKNQILEMYLNQVPYGGSSYGIEEASKIYFGKHASELTLPDAAFLAGLPQAPSTYSPFTNPKLALQRRNEVLQKMYEQSYISKDEKNKAQNEKLEVILPKTTIKAPHFVFYLKSNLENEYGTKEVEEGGLSVVSTLDLDIQEKAEQILREELEKIKNLNVTNGAILVTKPLTGEILAMVGSVDYFASSSGAFNVTTALRQPGSSIKPIMYSLALEKGYTAASIIDDSPIVFNVPGAEIYRPVNYDGRFHGKTTLRLALANSYNVPAVKVLNSLNVENFINHAKGMGISTWKDTKRYGLSLTLGGGEVTMIDMATAFGVFANEGSKIKLNDVIKLERVSGETLDELNPEKNKVINQEAAFIISDILSDNIARQQAFGSRSYLEIPGSKVAVKTGTTDNKKDNWTIGYTPEFLVAVWVGNNDGTPMNQYLASGVTGAAPIWNRVMSYLLQNYGDGKKWFEKPEGIVEKKCFFGKNEYFIKGTENKTPCYDALLIPSPSAEPTKAP